MNVGGVTISVHRCQTCAVCVPTLRSAPAAVSAVEGGSSGYAPAESSADGQLRAESSGAMQRADVAPGAASQPGAPARKVRAPGEAQAGRGAGGRKPGQLSPEDQAVVVQLSRRDAQVRAHEAAHMAAGGSAAGGATFTYQMGPDGRPYAVGGEVQVRIQSGATPQQTAANAAQVRAAAMAPADPSGADLAVAAAAAAVEAKAMRDLGAKPGEAPPMPGQKPASEAESVGDEPAAPWVGEAPTAEGGPRDDGRDARPVDARFQRASRVYRAVASLARPSAAAAA